MTTTPPEPPPEDDRPADAPGAPGGGAVPPPPPAGGGYGTPDPGYGTPPGSGYGTPPAPATAHPARGTATRRATPEAPRSPAAGYAPWLKRVQGSLIDFFGPRRSWSRSSSGRAGWARSCSLPCWPGASTTRTSAGTTGQSYGKKIAGTRLILEATGQPPGGGLGIGRFFVHILDALPCYLGFLWPLWDSKRQTFADKILKTVVVTV